MTNTKKQHRGFTLLETLMAISVISISIIGPLAMAANASRLISTARNQLTAVYLAQEAIELVRYQRDTNMIGVANGTETDWLKGLRENCTGQGCFVDSESDGAHFFACKNLDLLTFPFSDCNDAYMIYSGDNPGQGYKYKTATVNGGPTSFKRFILIEPFTIIDQTPGSEEGAKVKVKVMWKDAYGEKTINVQENIYNYL